MSKTTRLAGIDLCRGLAAFAVILVHSGDETWGIPISNQAIQFRYLFYYAVPFFLAAFFYFSTKKLPLALDSHFWHKKLQRIVIPYMLWSIFYVVSKTVIFILTNDTNQLQQLLADPVAIIFFGAASYHLYFIPLLLSGTILLYLANYLSNKQNSLFRLFILSVSSIFLYQLLMISNNDFNLDSYTAFPQLLQLVSPNNLFYNIWRILLVNFAWMIRCIPYFLVALFVNKIFEKNGYRWLYEKETVAAILMFFILVDIASSKYLPGALSEILIAYSLLVFGIATSQYISQGNIISNLGLCSFGIYLIHPFVKSAVEIALVIVLPQATQSVSISSILIYSTSSFLLSWIVISLIQKNRFISQYI